MESQGAHKRPSTACNRCYRRKQKCIGTPVCDNCQRANVTCQRSGGSARRQRYRHRHLSRDELLDTIALLEDQLSTGPSQDYRQETPAILESPSRHLALHQAIASTSAAGPVPSKTASVTIESLDANDNTTRSMHPENPAGSGRTSEPRASGHHPSGGLDLNDADQDLHQLVWERVTRRRNPRSQYSPPSSTEPQGVATAADKEMESQMLRAYLENVQVRMPFLDFHEVHRLHRQRHQSLPHHGDWGTDFQKFKLYMIYAIGARAIKVRQLYARDTDKSFYSQAADCLPRCGLDSADQTLEALTLVILYRVRLSLSPSIWSHVGQAMITAVEECLHREHTYRNSTLDVLSLSRRRSLFWSIYILERMHSWSLRLPLNLAEHEIDTQIPKVADLELGLQFDIEAGGLISKQELDEKAPQPRAFIGMIQLLRISSKIYTEIYRVDRYVQTSAIRPLLEELKTFEETIQPSTSWDRDWLLMHCKDAVRRLIEPFLSRIEVYDDLLNEAMHAAGQMCQLFKKLHVHNAMGASFLMCNSVFIAGLTLCYILLKAPSLWGPAASNYLRACSSSLLVVAETNPSLRKYYNVLEATINGVMGRVFRLDSPTSNTNDAGKTLAESPVQLGRESPIQFPELQAILRSHNFEFPLRCYPDYIVKPPDAGPRAPSSRQLSSGPNQSHGGITGSSPRRVRDDTTTSLDFSSFLQPPGQTADFDSDTTALNMWDFAQFDFSASHAAYTEHFPSIDWGTQLVRHRGDPHAMAFRS